MTCRKHQSYAHCPDCGAEFNIPNGFVLIPEVDVAKLNAFDNSDARAWFGTLFHNLGKIKKP